jgi:hypothetical protein
LVAPGPIGSGPAAYAVPAPSRRGLRGYTDANHDFAIAYPADYTIRRARTGSSFAIRTAEGEQAITCETYRLADFPRDMFRGSRDIFRDFAVDRAVAGCCADGPDGAAYCNAIHRISQTRTNNGLRLIEIYLVHVQEFYGDRPERTESIVGPVYAVDVSRPDETVLLMIAPRPYESLSGERAQLAQIVAGNVKLVQPRQAEPPEEVTPEGGPEKPGGAVPVPAEDDDPGRASPADN